MNEYFNPDYEPDYADLAWEPPDSGYCACCGEEADAKIIDEGIGVYEYGSAREVDVQLVTVSDCCEDELLKEPPEQESEDDE